MTLKELVLFVVNKIDEENAYLLWIALASLSFKVFELENHTGCIELTEEGTRIKISVQKDKNLKYDYSFLVPGHALYVKLCDLSPNEFFNTVTKDFGLGNVI